MRNGDGMIWGSSRESSLIWDPCTLGERVELMVFPDRLDVGWKDKSKYLGSNCKGGCCTISNSGQSFLEGFPALHNIKTIHLLFTLSAR